MAARDAKEPVSAERLNSPEYRDGASQRESLVWQTIAGFVGFFTLLAGIQAVWNLFRDDPQVLPAVVFAALLAVSVLVWRARPHGAPINSVLFCD